MPDQLTVLITWINTHRGLAIAVAVALTATILAIVTIRIVAFYRGRSLSARASIGFAVVQAGVAYVTITGVYEFWAHVVGLPAWDAAGIAVFIEAVTWAAVAMIFDHGGKAGTVGFGDAAGLFWLSILGGGVMAIAGSGSIRVAVGRAVVVVLGAAMWHLRLRQRTRRSATPSRWVNPFKQALMASGWLIPGEQDVTATPREWQVRRLTRAIRRTQAPRPWVWIGKRTIQRIMDAGDADMVQQAQHRYALQHVLASEIRPDSPSMAAAIVAARAALEPAPVPGQPVEPPPPNPSAAASPAESSAVVRRTPPNHRTALARPRADEAGQRRLAEAAAEAALRGGGSLADPAEPLTGKALGARFGRGEEWGRIRIREARGRVGSVNGSHPAT